MVSGLLHVLGGVCDTALNVEDVKYQLLVQQRQQAEMSKVHCPARILNVPKTPWLIMATPLCPASDTERSLVEVGPSLFCQVSKAGLVWWSSCGVLSFRVSFPRISFLLIFPSWLSPVPPGGSWRGGG